ncbi:hypothetical protein [Luteococcus sp. OSA5]|uniref:hypothetical protein n=1 Tax=Luteococcus sp. OSA5 TaxID=3401630 RepID=UPI003B4384C5
MSTDPLPEAQQLVRAGSVVQYDDDGALLVLLDDGTRRQVDGHLVGARRLATGQRVLLEDDGETTRVRIAAAPLGVHLPASDDRA